MDFRQVYKPLTEPSGSRILAMMGLTRVGGIESRSCGISSKSIGFEEAVEVITEHYPLKMADQFKQGISKIAVFQGFLAGYPGSMAISVQSGDGITVVSIYELPNK